jgi:hypothetical protein
MPISSPPPDARFQFRRRQTPCQPNTLTDRRRRFLSATPFHFAYFAAFR